MLNIVNRPEKEYRYRSYESNGMWVIERAVIEPFETQMYNHGYTPAWHTFSTASTKAEADEIVRKARVKIIYHYY